MEFPAAFAFLDLHALFAVMLIFSPFTAGYYAGRKRKDKRRSLTHIEAVVIFAGFILFAFGLGFEARDFLSFPPIFKEMILAYTFGLGSLATIIYTPYKFGEWIGWKSVRRGDAKASVADQSDSSPKPNLEK